MSRIMGNKLQDALARVASKRERYAYTEPEPKCATCKDTGWQELPNGRWRHCWRKCEIPSLNQRLDRAEVAKTTERREFS